MTDNHQRTLKEAASETIKQIEIAFGGVSREGGVSLHETRVLDDGVSEVEREAARAKDLDVDWREVPDSILGKPGLSLNFLDPIGFRYYIAAYMVWEIRQILEGLGDNCNVHAATLCALRSWDNRQLLSPGQSQAIYQFLRFYAEYGEEFEREEAQAAIKEYWFKFRSTPRSEVASQ